MQIIGQAKFTYSPLRKAFEKQMKIIKDQEEKQRKAIENQEQIKTIKRFDYNESHWFQNKKKSLTNM